MAAGPPVQDLVAECQKQRRKEVADADGADSRGYRNRQHIDQRQRIAYAGEQKGQLALRFPAAAAVGGQQRLHRIGQKRHQPQQNKGNPQFQRFGKGL